MNDFKFQFPFFIPIAIIILVTTMFSSCTDKKLDDNASNVKELVVEQIEHNVTVHHGGEKAFSYVYDEAQFKPYVKELYSPGGVNVLLDSPADHKHHHGLMFAVKVDGVNFWEEVEQSGRQQPQNTIRAIQVSDEEKSQISYESTINWIQSHEEEVLLNEKRSITYTIPKNMDARFLSWTSQLTLAENKSSAQLSGAHYHGLGMRFIRAMDENGRFFTAGAKTGTIFRGEERLIPDIWCAYAANTGGKKQVTVAMFRDPRNPGEDTVWFTMKKPFAYLSATRAWHENAFLLRAGETLSLTYHIAVMDGLAKTNEIENIYDYCLKYNLKKGGLK